MKVFHTSPNEITKITKDGFFGECLFFSDHVYQMSSCDVITYSLEIRDEKIVEARTFFFREDYNKLDSIIEKIINLTDCDEDTAQEYLCGNEFTANDEHDLEIQGMMGDAAKLLGFECAESEDEQGTVYIVPMFGRESELVIEA